MNVIILDTVNSTNLYAKENIDNFSDKTVIIAKKQTDGRGRFTRKWVDFGYGNLFMSIVLKPSAEFVDTYSNLTQYLSVILCKTIESYNLKTQIKWPNDVLINGKKVAGILAQTVMQGKTFKGIVLGIGVNLSATQADVASIKERTVTSLNLETPADISNFKELLLDNFFKDYDKFLKNGFEFIKHDYISRISMLNTEINVQSLNKIHTGIAKDINDNGELVLEKDGKQTLLTIGDIL